MASEIDLLQGDCLELLREFPENFFDSCVTDPPYELAFMGRSWDTQGISFRPETWKTILRVLKPGAHLLAFGGSRTFHRIACAIEDAGFELRDNLCWLFGSGFPKSMDVSRAIDREAGATRRILGPKIHGDGKLAHAVKASKSKSLSGPTVHPMMSEPATDAARKWSGWGTALKPAYEPVLLTRKPISEKTIAANVLKWGTGGINIDGCRIYAPGGSPAVQRRKYTVRPNPRTAAESNAIGRIERRGDPEKVMIPRPSESVGRFPANLLLSHSPDCREIGTKRVKGSGSKPSSVGRGRNGNFSKGIYGAKASKVTISHVAQDGTEIVTAWACVDGCPVQELDWQSGEVGAFSPVTGREPTASGFSGAVYGYGGVKRSARAPFYEDSGGASRFFYCTKASRRERNGGMKPGERGGGRVRVEDFNIHPTVKPLKLMRYLARLVTPPGGVVLDPFAGSGTTGLAARAEGFESVLIEREAEYCRIIERRCGL